ncbi:23S rRNA (cytosine1962-C5)-methyltransferase [Chitinophaga terrae (ex Kim and Jung 2007)]|uniref:class I SAM-dependent rRNA methyltransferase n=1 Tax=Chitinophaga terrae (ex Kim and Jung 2007) TaxID=408074 RepID=UPI00277EC614|nr:class I SAM-dependent rRNA methyltransferase [Chitinophaga terrae (ex Kim and Jung 2007)]MDQ0107723.1 23S rRNA (cytosine1962-C5)-methyltransferase [Chitinophaga terrae (ex Kim and Jung 2007)]
MTKVFLKKQIQNRVLLGHPWVFGNEVAEIKGDVTPGDIVEVFTHKGIFVGKGYINPQSQILVRILTRDRNEIINDEFFYQRILKCWQYRQKIGYVENCRLVFGEADDLPALVIDKFNDYFVIQTMALGIERWKDAIVAALNRIFQPKGIYERNDVPVRELEGMQQQKGFLSAPFDTNIIINENGLKFHVDIVNGQKTGYFLDQQDNRREIRNIVKGADVLEAFCYTGTFSCHAGYYGAEKVLGLDISETAIQTARRNATLNGLDDICKFEAINAFDQLKQWTKEDRKFDVVMLDPPAFTKSRENIQKAVAGYKEINLRGMKLLKPGGFLVTASCTNLVNPELFLQTIDAAARDAKKRLKQVTFQSQAQDHPILRNIDNTTYLKFLIVEVS